jgi:hypothetical protein
LIYFKLSSNDFFDFAKNYNLEIFYYYSCLGVLMYRYIFVSLIFISSIFVFPSLDENGIKRRGFQLQIEQPFNLQKQSDQQLDLKSDNPECLCSSDRVYDYCEAVDDWGYAPALCCCLTIVYTLTGSFCKALSATGLCCILINYEDSCSKKLKNPSSSTDF